MGRMILFVFALVGCEPMPSGTSSAAAPAKDACTVARVRFHRASEGGTTREAVAFLSAHPDCFVFDDARGRGEVEGAFRTAAEETIREAMAVRHTDVVAPDTFQKSCEQYTALIAHPQLGLASSRCRDPVHVLCAYADAYGETESGFLSALSGIEQVQNDKLRLATRDDLITDAYAVYYRDATGETSFDTFRETYPLAKTIEPLAFAHRLIETKRLIHTPLPLRFFEEHALGEAAQREVFLAHITSEIDLSGSFDAAVTIAAAYVKAGYDPALVYRTTFDRLCELRAYTEALRVAHQHLDAKAVHLAEDGRIRSLEAQGRYSIAVGGDGKRTKVFPMWDE